MKAIYALLVAAVLSSCNRAAATGETSTTTTKSPEMAEQTASHEQQNFYDFKTQTLEGDNFDFSELKGKRVLIVNTASECGYTPQYEQLQELYNQYGGEDFTIVGFPSNDFGKQEPGSDKDIKEFCERNFGVEFPMMSKTRVTGENKHPVYQWLTDKERNGRKSTEVQWNFNKFLVDENGEWFAYFPSNVKPMDERIVNFAKGENRLE